MTPINVVNRGEKSISVMKWQDPQPTSNSTLPKGEPLLLMPGESALFAQGENQITVDCEGVTPGPIKMVEKLRIRAAGEGIIIVGPKDQAYLADGSVTCVRNVRSLSTGSIGVQKGDTKLLITRSKPVRR